MVIGQKGAEAPPADTDERWGRQVDMAGVEYFSVVIDPMDAKDTVDGGIRELMGMSPDMLANVIFAHVDEELWFRPSYVLWGPAVADYDDDEPIAGVRCTMIGFI